MANKFRASIEKKIRAEVASGRYGECDELDILEMIEEELDALGFYDAEENRAERNDTPCLPEVSHA